MSKPSAPAGPAGPPGAARPAASIPMRGPMGMMGPPQKPKRFGPSARRLFGLLGPRRRTIAVVIALALGSVALSVTGPRILGHATDLLFRGYLGHRLPAGVSRADAAAHLRATGNGRTADLIEAMHVEPGVGVDLDALAHVLGWLIALYALASLLLWLQGYLLNGVVQGTVRRLRADVDAKLMRVPLAYFDRQPHGEVLSRVTNDIDNLAMALQQSLSQILVSLLTAVGVLVMLVVLSPLLALITLVTIPLSVFLTARIGKRAQQAFVAQWKHVGTLNGQVEEAFSGHALVTAFGRRPELEARFGGTNGALYDAGVRATFVSSLLMPTIQFVGNLGYVAIAVVGGLRVASGAMLLGAVTAFIQYTRQFSQNLSQLAQVSSTVQSGVASAERVFELLDEPDQSPERADATLPAPIRGEVRFEDVGFRYRADAPLIDGLSLTARPGQTVAIVGPTGAGKTTLVNLLMRFYDLGAGRITVDGVDLAAVPRADARRVFGMVLQDTWLTTGTIADNIRYGDPTATDEQVRAAARAAYVDRFVRALPAGYATPLDPDSASLSAGEKQLITIARAFLADPAILILDEATSSVDTRTEALSQRAMASLRAGRTSFVIAHRLSTIRDADLILVLDHGAIVEQGTHAELLAAGGAYHRLYHAQFAAPTA